MPANTANATKPRIAIAGAGIGGLCLANCLQEQGLDFHIYEKANELTTAGYGIQLSPNAVQVLNHLKLTNKLAEVSHQCQRFTLHNLANDKVLVSWEFENELPYFQCLRSDLHKILADRIPAEKISFGRSIESCQMVKETKVVGADGVHSLIRKRLNPSYVAAHSGYNAYRMVLDVDPEKKYELDYYLQSTSVWLGRDKHIVVYPVAAGQQVNCVFITKSSEKLKENWVDEVDISELFRLFKSDSRHINYLLKQIKQQNKPVYRWGLLDHTVLPKWHDDKHVLLGDAAHPTLPFMAQGAAMAIEDAYVFAQCLSNYPSFNKASAAYQRKRKLRTAKIQDISRKNAEIFHAIGVKKLGRNLFFSLAKMVNPQLMQQRTNWIYNHRL